MVADEVETSAPEHIHLPPWHWLKTWGMWIFVGSLLVMYLATYFPAALPEVPTSKYGESIDLSGYEADLNKAKLNIQVHFFLNWAANNLLAGGFFMWLAGCMIDAFRHPQA